MGIDHGLLNYYHFFFFFFFFFFFHFFFFSQIFKGKQLWNFSICLQDDKFHPKQGLLLKNKNLLLYFIATEKGGKTENDIEIAHRHRPMGTPKLYPLAYDDAQS